jgi:hypothetical protein
MSSTFSRDRGVSTRISAWAPWMLGGLIVFLFLLAFIYGNLTSHSVSQSPAAQPQQVHIAGAGRSGQSLGDPAITPHLNLNAPNAAEASLPTYTVADATAYANAHRPDGMISLAPFAVTKVQFMTDAQADQQLNTVMGVSKRSCWLRPIDLSPHSIMPTRSLMAGQATWWSR